jgi:hypothetical protein
MTDEQKAFEEFHKRENFYPIEYCPNGNYASMLFDAGWQAAKAHEIEKRKQKVEGL